jgi:hypothetical protein
MDSTTNILPQRPVERRSRKWTATRWENHPGAVI